MWIHIRKYKNCTGEDPSHVEGILIASHLVNYKISVNIPIEKRTVFDT